MKIKRKSLNLYMRSLHRDIGFFLIGLTVIYSISGVILIYRDTDFLKHEALVEKKLSPNIELSKLGKVLHIKNFQVLKTDGKIVYFKNGTYDNETGIAKYSTKELPLLINKFNKLHKASSSSILHWFTTIFGILLLFMAISSFWMFKPKTKLFRRGLYFSALGIVAAIILFML